MGRPLPWARWRPEVLRGDRGAFEPHTFLAEGDKVVVLGFERLRAKRTGRSYETHWVHAFTLANGKIVKFREYCDTATVAAAFRNG